MDQLLIYTTIGKNPAYLPFLELFCESLCSSHRYDKKNVCVISDISFHKEVHAILSKYAALNFYIHDVCDSFTSQEASMNKTKIFEFKDIYKFKTCMFVDIDCLFMNSLNFIFKHPIKDNTVYVYSEYKEVELNNSIYYSLRDKDGKCYYNPDDANFLKKYNKCPMNAGLFLFCVSETMQSHFENLKQLMKTPGYSSFYEQGYLNTYFHLTNISNNSLFDYSNVLMLHNRPIEEYKHDSHAIVHFNHGMAGDAAHKHTMIVQFWLRQKQRAAAAAAAADTPRIYPTRAEMIADLIAPRSEIIEIGVFKGEFAEQMAMLNPKQLHLVDIWENAPINSGDMDGNNVETIPNAQTLHTLVCNKFRFNSNIKIHRMRSDEFLKLMKPRSVDVVYIDGDHSYEGVKSDLEHSLPIIRKYGWIMGHDYEMNMEKTKNYYNFGVKRAVDEFCLKYGLRIYAKGNDGCVSYAILVDKDI